VSPGAGWVVRRGSHRCQDEDGTWEKDTKQHQQRRNAIDPETVAVLAEHWSRCQQRAAALGIVLTELLRTFLVQLETQLGPAPHTQVGST